MNENLITQIQPHKNHKIFIKVMGFLLKNKNIIN